jgi:plasmid stabilization system protein ParE
LKLRYTPRAAAELGEILDYIAARSPQGQRRVMARLQFITRLIVEQPYSGKRTSLRGGRVRRVMATPYPFLVFYEVGDDEIVVISVRHAARDPASMPGESDVRSTIGSVPDAKPDD